MGTQLAFPLAMPLGGVLVSNIFAQALGQNQWLVRWDTNPDLSPASYMIYVDGNFWGVIVDTPAMFIRGEDGASPVVQVAQLPIAWSDPGFARDGYFTAPVANKIQVVWDPPADVTDVDKYRVYFDNKTGTVDFTTSLGEVPEDGSTQYEFWTAQLVSGTYKFVIRVVDLAGNESTNIAEFSVVLSTYPGLVTGEAVSVIAGPKVTITWTDPSDIGSGNVRVYSNGGITTLLRPDYSSAVATVPAGTQTFTSAVLGDGIHVFGLRVFNGTVEELNTYVWLVVRIESGAEVALFPQVPLLVAQNDVSGKISLTARVNNLNPTGTNPVKVQFYTNDGAGGAVDFSTPLEGVGSFTTLSRHGSGLSAQFLTASFGETVRKFSCRSFTTAGVASVNAVEITITPDATSPPDPLNTVVVAGRN